MNTRTLQMIRYHHDGTNQKSFDDKKLSLPNEESARELMESKDFINYINTHGYHFNDKLAMWASRQMINEDGSLHSWKVMDCEAKAIELGISIPTTSTSADFTYTANMAYADFYPTLISEKGCLIYANIVANDPDGYEGIQFSRWLADIIRKKVNVPWGEVV